MERKDFLLLLGWLFLTLTIVAIPFRHVGESTVNGFAYRAYFNADFFRNMSVTGSLLTTGIPPANAYFSGEVLNYHWFFQILPAYFHQLFPSYRLDLLLVQFSVCVALMFVSALFIAVRSLSTSRSTLALTFPLFAFGGSYEAIVILRRLKEQNLPLDHFKNFNMDGVTRWLWNAPQIDTLYRAILYAPQHLIVLTIFLIFLVGWKRWSSGKQQLIFYVLLFSAVAFSTFLAGVLCLTVGVLLFIRLVREGDHRFWLFCALGVCFFVVYSFAFRIFEVESSSLVFGLDRSIAQHFGKYFFAEYGAVLLLGIAGIILRPEKWLFRILLALLIACSIIIVFARLDLPDRSVFSIKFGYLCQLILLLLGASFLDRMIALLRGKVRWLVVPLGLLLSPSFLTWMMDCYNSQDIANKKFTSYISKEEANLFFWIQHNLPADAVIQNYWLKGEGYVERFVTEIPPFAQRAVFLSDPILSRLFQVPEEHVSQRVDAVCKIFNAEHPAIASDVAQKTGIDYLLVETQHPHNLQEPYFTKVKQEKKLAIYSVNHVNVGLLPKKPLHQSAILTPCFGKNFYAPEVHKGCEKARWVSDDGQILMQSPKDISGKISFTAHSLGRHRTLQFFHNGRLVSQSSISDIGTVLNMTVQLSAGENEFRIRAVEGPEKADRYANTNDPRLLSFKIFRFRFESS